jgi:hypothetical protein
VEELMGPKKQELEEEKRNAIRKNDPNSKIGRGATTRLEKGPLSAAAAASTTDNTTLKEHTDDVDRYFTEASKSGIGKGSTQTAGGST